MVCLVLKCSAFAYVVLRRFAFNMGKTFFLSADVSGLRLKQVEDCGNQYVFTNNIARLFN